MQKILQKTLKSRTIFCRDNLEVLRGINSESIDLVYLDPPFNKGQYFHAPIGTTAEGAEFKDIWREEDTKEEWHGLIAKEQPALYEYLSGIEQVGDKSNKYYLIYMAARLLELHRILKPSGAIYLHCDPTMSHYLKILLDSIFGHKNFRNEIIWLRRKDIQNAVSNHMGSTHDVIFFYAKSDAHRYQGVYTAYSDEYVEKFYKYTDDKGRYRLLPTTNDTESHKEYTFRGITRRWRWTKENMDRRYKEGLLWQKTPTSLFYYKKYLADAKGVPIQDIWTDIAAVKGRTSAIYITQKPLALLERIIKGSSPVGGIVLDPFCGCATTCIAAEKLGRAWVGIDVSSRAYDLVRMRIEKEVPGQSPGELALYDKVIYREDIPQRSDVKEPLQRKEIIKETLFGRQKGYCNGCRESVRGHVAFDYHHLEVDHIIPKSKGGGDNIENLQLLCGHCNKLKGAKDMAYLRTKLKEYKLIP